MKYANVLGQFLAVVMLVFLSSGCSKDDASSDDENVKIDYASKVHSLDLSGAQGLYITGDSASSGAASPLRSEEYSADTIQKAANAVDLDPNSVYKITADGRLERVAIEDENGEELPRASVKPVKIQDLNSLYLVIWLKIEGDGSGGIPYLVHKSSGFAYNASKVIWNASKTVQPDGTEVYEIYDQNIQFDRANNFYLKRTKIGSDDMNFESIYKIDTSTLGSSSLTVTEIPSAYSFQNTSWIVDDSGEFIVFGGGSATIGDSPVRYLSITTGAIHNINEEIDGTFDPYWIKGLDGKIYTSVINDMVCDDTVDQCVTWYRIEADTNHLPVITEVAKSNDVPMHWALGANRRHVIGGKLLYITDDTSSFGIEEVDPVAGTVFHHYASFSDVFTSVEKYVVSGSDIYIFGRLSSTTANGFYKYNVLTRTGQAITVESGYDAHKFTVLADGSFLVEGIRLSDQAYFYGQLATDGKVTETSTVALGTPTVLVMEAIKPADFMMIDGNPSDWPTSLRVLNDISGDSTKTDGDLLYYSQTTTSTQYFGMIEHGEDFNRSYYLRVTFESGEQLQFQEDNATILPDNTLTEAGGIVSRGSVVEFSMPIDTVSTPNVLSVKLFGTTSSGDINTSMLIDEM